MGAVTGTFYHVKHRSTLGSTMQCQSGRDAEGLRLTSSTTAALVKQTDGSTDWTAPGSGIVKLECDKLAWAKVGEKPTAAQYDALKLKASEPEWFSVEEGDQISVKDDA